MKRFLLIVSFLSVINSSFSQPAESSATALPRPKLVVGLVIDQMRWDYLYRYYERYGNNGFKRILNEGFSAENTQITYLPTFTACGHASLYTGSVPAINGITGNDWIIEATGKRMYCTDDSTAKPVGSTSKAGKMSPKNLLSNTITDELKLATNFRSKVIGIAIKDRGGILPAGHTADAAYWYDDLTGNWITSTYYREDLPAWVKSFNNKGLVKKYLSQKWETLYPLNTYVQSSADNSSKHEGTFKNEKAPVFPHSFSNTDFGTFRTTPFANTLTFDFAKAALENEEMGKDAITDFLAMSISSTDYIGHQFGPNSVEAEDTYLRLDKDIADFLSYLDNTVGKGEYTIFLSADHGAAHNPTFLTDNKMPAGVWAGKLDEINKILANKYGPDKLIRSLSNYQVHFDHSAVSSKSNLAHLIKLITMPLATLLTEKELNLKLIKEDVIAYFKAQPEIAFVVDVKNIANEPIPETLKTRIVNGYNEKRSGEIQIVLNPGYYQGSNKHTTGTTHGTWSPYDTHIPLLFMGWGIKQGKTNRPTSMSDVASTLAALLRIQEPNGNIGQPVLEALK